MLTFFDYLRQRAFESIMAGAQEALELLERESSHSRPETPATRRTPAALAPPESPAEMNTNNHSSANRLLGEDDDPLPAPRRRGRPNQKKRWRR